jgi:hypothetical protein
MEKNALLAAVLEGVHSKPLGTRLLPPLADDELAVAIEHFSADVWRDHELARLRIADLDALNQYVTECSRKKSPNNLGDEARLALVLLSYLFSEMHERTNKDMRSREGEPVVISLGSDLASAKKELGKIKARKRWGRMSEDCMLNAASLCSNPAILIAAGRYYLELMDADVPTAIAYFIAACDRGKADMRTCDRMIDEFMLQRMHLYIGMSLVNYLEEWKTFKRTHAGANR